MKNRSNYNREESAPYHPGCIHLTLKLRLTAEHRRALGRRLEVDGGRMAGPRACLIALEGVVAAYLKELEREAFAADLLEAVHALNR
jgi:hypothetical protein